MDSPALLTVEEVGAALRCSRAQVFRLLASGVLQRGARYGRKAVITAESVQAACQAVPEAPAPRRRQRVRKVDIAAQADAVLAAHRASAPRR